MNISNQLSLSRIFFTIGIIVSFVFWNISLSNNILYACLITLFFVLGCLSDFLDGYIARKYKLETKFGKFIDPITDKILINTTLIIIISMLDWYKFLFVIIAVLMIARDNVVDFMRMMVAKKGIIIPANIFGKIKTILQMIALIILSMTFWINQNGLLITGTILLCLALITSLISGYIYVTTLYKHF